MIVSYSRQQTFPHLHISNLKLTQNAFSKFFQNILYFQLFKKDSILKLFFSDWSMENGGYTSYIAKGEEEEVLFALSLWFYLGFKYKIWCPHKFFMFVLSFYISYFILYLSFMLFGLMKNCPKECRGYLVKLTSNLGFFPLRPQLDDARFLRPSSEPL